LRVTDGVASVVRVADGEPGVARVEDRRVDRHVRPVICGGNVARCSIHRCVGVEVRELAGLCAEDRVARDDPERDTHESQDGPPSMRLHRSLPAGAEWARHSMNHGTKSEARTLKGTQSDKESVKQGKSRLVDAS
jgi:hypothetical protein